MPNDVDRELWVALGNAGMWWCAKCMSVVRACGDDRCLNCHAWKSLIPCAPYSEYEDNPLTRAIAEQGMEWEKHRCDTFNYLVFDGERGIAKGNTLTEAFRNALLARKEGA